MTVQFGLFRPAHTFGNLLLVAFLLAAMTILLCAAPTNGHTVAASLLQHFA